MSRKKSKAILHTKVLLKNGVIVEMKIWAVDDQERYPDGYKYSLFAIHEGKTLVGYDNHHPKGIIDTLWMWKFRTHSQIFRLLEMILKQTLKSNWPKGGFYETKKNSNSN